MFSLKKLYVDKQSTVQTGAMPNGFKPFVWLDGDDPVAFVQRGHKGKAPKKLPKTRVFTLPDDINTRVESMEDDLLVRYRNVLCAHCSKKASETRDERGRNTRRDLRNFYGALPPPKKKARSHLWGSNT